MIADREPISLGNEICEWLLRSTLDDPGPPCANNALARADPRSLMLTRFQVLGYIKMYSRRPAVFYRQYRIRCAGIRAVPQSLRRAFGHSRLVCPPDS